MMNKDNTIIIRNGMGWIAWFFLLFWDFKEGVDLYDAILEFLLRVST